MSTIAAMSANELAIIIGVAIYGSIGVYTLIQWLRGA